MQSDAQPTSMLWAGWIMSALPSLFLLVDGINETVEASHCRGDDRSARIPRERHSGLGIVLLACTVLYLIPHTAVLGAILLTGYLSGAVATHVRVSAGLFEILFPVIFGALLWGGLFLRDERLRELIPLRIQLRPTTHS